MISNTSVNNIGDPQTGDPVVKGASAGTQEPPYSPELGKKFKNGPRKYQIIYNDPTGKRSIIRDDRRNNLLISHTRLQGLLKPRAGGTIDLSKVRRLDSGKAAYFMRHTNGGQRYRTSDVSEREQKAADEKWKSYAKSQRPAGSYYSDGRAAMIHNTKEAPKPGAATYYPVSHSYRKGGILYR